MHPQFALALGLAATLIAQPAAAANKHKPAAKTRPAAQASAKPSTPTSARSAADVIKNAPDADWRALDPLNTLVMTLPKGQVVIEMAPRFAPTLAENVRALARAGYFDGLAIIRVQENYVTQWGDPEEDDAKARPLPAGVKGAAEFSVPLKGLPLTRLGETDGWAALNGFVDGFPVAANPRTGRAWLAHCYSTVGVARGNTPDSGTGSSLYVAIGQSPRALENNIAALGRVIQGMELLSSLPRGKGNLGFYDKAEERTPIASVKVAADLPEAERPSLQVLRTDSQSWADLLDARRHRSGWYVQSPERTDLCSGTVPTRTAP